MLTNLHLNCQKRSKKEKFTQSPSATMNVKRINLSKAKKKNPPLVRRPTLESAA
jgi:hypothetical protein